MLAALASSPRVLSLLILLLLLLTHHVKSDERQILLNLKSSLVKTKNSKLIFNSWNDSNSICSFHGITCNPTASVTEIDLSNQNLSGVLPLQSLCNLHSLEKLVLGSNNFHGRVAEDLRNCVKLRLLDLGNNFFSGPFPDISSLHNLQYLLIDNNGFSGTFPWQSLLNMTTSLLQLFVGDNCFDLTPFPKQVFSLKKLNRLYLRSYTLGGRIPVEIGNLTELTELVFDDNFFVGELPVEIGKLQKLRVLDFCDNFLTGKIPIGLRNLTGLNFFYGSINQLEGDLSELRFLTNLVSVLLDKNNFSGEIPPEFGEFKHLQKLTLYGNRLTGPIPQKNGTSTLCNASSLNVLNLAHNNLTGMIPQCLATLPFLSILDMQMNNFYGSMPRSFSKKNVFETIKLNGNQLEGPLPRSLAHCTKLQVLDVGDNNIEDTFPNWLETLPELQVLSLRFNKLHGAITCSSIKHPFPKLRTFDVSNNNFSGPLPTSCIKNFQGMMNVNESQIGLKYMGDVSYYNDSVVVIMKGHYVELTRILTTFTTIDLSNNMFEGEIPEVMGELNSLKGLNLSHNGITDTIPQSLSNLRNLEWLDLSWNQLTGEVPVALTNLNFLSFLNLSQNQFEGIIPTGKQFDTFGNDSYEGNPMLCGFPLSKSCNNHEDWPPHSTSRHEESGFGWKPVAMGYACGAVFGMLLGHNVFLTGKPQWLARLAESMFNIRLKRINNRASANRRRMN